MTFRIYTKSTDSHLKKRVDTDLSSVQELVHCNALHSLHHLLIGINLQKLCFGSSSIDEGVLTKYNLISKLYYTSRESNNFCYSSVPNLISEKENRLRFDNECNASSVRLALTAVGSRHSSNNLIYNFILAFYLKNNSIKLFKM